MCTTCVREFSGAFIIALDIEKEDIRTCARTSDLTKCILFFPLTRKKDVSFCTRNFASFSHSGVVLTHSPRWARQTTQGKRVRVREGYTTHTHTRGGVHFFSFFSLQRRYICALSEHISPKRFLFVFPQQTSACIEERALVSLLSILDNAYAK